MPLFYKYFGPAGIAALETMTLSASDPTSFNDPFEVRPAFDQERHDYFARTHESFHAALGFGTSLCGTGSMVGFPTENAVDFGERITKRLRQELRSRFRIVCLSRNSDNVLMWGHYTQSHRGLVLGFDFSQHYLQLGLKSDGFTIEYPESGDRVRLPRAYYRGVSVEMSDQSGNIVNSPDQQIEGDSGLLIPFSEYRRQVESALIECLTTKAHDWRYEQEVRFIFDLKEHGAALRVVNGKHFLPTPETSLREVIVGFRASYAMVERIVNLFHSGNIGQPKLFFSGCHPYLYEVQKHETDPQYLLDYYRIVRPSLDPSE